jgi:dephospho-CoA kinase
MTGASTPLRSRRVRSSPRRRPPGSTPSFTPAYSRRPAVVVLEIPLLVEAPGFFDLVDGVLAVSSHEDSRLARLAARGTSEDDARARMDAQATDAERRDIADWVIENDGTLADYRALLADFWDNEVASRVG